MHAAENARKPATRRLEPGTQLKPALVPNPSPAHLLSPLPPLTCTFLACVADPSPCCPQASTPPRSGSSISRSSTARTWNSPASDEAALADSSAFSALSSVKVRSAILNRRLVRSEQYFLVETFLEHFLTCGHGLFSRAAAESRFG